MTIGALSFLSPWLLTGLFALPIIYWLLRTVPPRPRQIEFPPTRILVDCDPYFTVRPGAKEPLSLIAGYVGRWSSALEAELLCPPPFFVTLSLCAIGRHGQPRGKLETSKFISHRVNYSVVDSIMCVQLE